MAGNTTPSNSIDSDRAAIDLILFPIRLFIRLEAASGILLMICTLAAIYLANSIHSHWYFHLWEIPVGIHFGQFSLEKPLHIWINDGLMAMFFFVVGLELKREILAGELASFGRALLPIAAALGGMVAPAILYATVNYNHPSLAGWGVPMATDIAFALGVITLLKNKIPFSLRIFLATLAIVDDLGAVLVIALFYTSHISFASLLIACMFFIVLITANYLGVRNIAFYLTLGIGGLWTAFLFSGIHPTIAGVLAAFTIPARAKIGSVNFVKRASSILNRIRESLQGSGNSNSQISSYLLQLKVNCDYATSPLHRIEKALHPFVLFVVMPIFAFANAGVIIDFNSLNALTDPTFLGIVLGLFIGKPIGIVIATALLVMFKISDLPDKITWRHIWGAGFLAGIGFTMSLFIATLAFQSPAALSIAKTAILVGSLLSGITGFLILSRGSS